MPSPRRRSSPSRSLLFFLLSKWSKRRARKIEQLKAGDPKGGRPPKDGKGRERGDKSGGPP